MASKPIGLTKWRKETWRVLYSTVEQVNEVLEMKKIEVSMFMLIPQTILRPSVYYVDLWLLTLKVS